MKRLLSTILLGIGLAANAQTLPYQNPNLSHSERAKDLCSRLTLEEKALLMMNNSPAIERLGIPAFNWWNEALHGVGRNGTATVFPITMGMAASFDDAMVEQVFSAVSDEARVKNNQAKRVGKTGELYHNLSFWTPNINIFRDPRWGRGQETYGEDPFLTSKMGVSVVKGLQGPSDTRYSKLLACAKHFAVHSGPEWNRHSFDVENLPARDLYETYLPAFKALVQEGQVSEIMCAYNRFEGQPCCGSNRLLHHILRDEWGFKGLVTSDCGAVSDFYNGHGYSKTRAEASAKAVIAGTDVECGDNYGTLVEAVAKGMITEEQINTSLLRLLEARFRLGDMTPDNLVSWTSIPDDVVASDKHRSLALKMAQESIVLLQNNHSILPLSKDEKVVVMGPNANDSIMLWGNYNGFPKHTVTMLEGIENKTSNVNYLYLPWDKRQNAKAIAQSVPEGKVLFFGGISPQLEGEEMPVNEPGFKGGDRLTIELPQLQRDVIAALAEAGREIVFVNCSGSAIALTPESQRCAAIVQAWYGGEWGGQAVADVLYGDVNPSGKLPITFYADDSQLPDFEDYTMKNRTYRYFDGTPLFAFGHGLSYTNFSISKPSYKNDKVVVKVKNTGKIDGTEIVQVYLSNPADTEGPQRALRAFQRVDLKAGETKTVEIDFPRERFEWWDAESNTMRIKSGKYILRVGNTSDAKNLKQIKLAL